MSVVDKILGLLENQDLNMLGLVDFMVNSFEHGSDEENLGFLMSEFGLSEQQAQKLVDNYLFFMKMKSTEEYESKISELIGESIVEKILRLLESINENEDKFDKLYYPGNTVEDNNIRYHRYSDQIQITDLTNAGKKGKRVENVSISKWGQDRTILNSIIDKVISLNDFQAIKKYAEGLKVSDTSVDVYFGSEGGVDVRPSKESPQAKETIEVQGDKIYVEAEFNSFVVRDLTDMANEPTLIPGRRKSTSVKKFYDLVKNNQDKIKNMSFSEIGDFMQENGIDSHYYLAVD